MIYQLDPSQWTRTATGVKLASTVPTHCSYTGCVLQVAFVIQRPVQQNPTDQKVYDGSEAVIDGQPILGPGNVLSFDSSSHVIVYSSANDKHNVREAFYWIPSADTMSITINQVPSSLFKVVMGGLTLVNNVDYTLVGRTLTINNTATTRSIATGSSIAITYVAQVLHSRGEPAYNICSGNTCTPVLYGAGVNMLTLGNEPKLYTGGQQLVYDASDPRLLAKPATQLTITAPAARPATSSTSGSRRSRSPWAARSTRSPSTTRTTSARRRSTPATATTSSRSARSSVTRR